MGNWTPLHECIRKDNPEAMQLIIDGGFANLEIKDIDGETPVFVASTNKRPECLATLLRAGANPNPTAGDGFSALMMSIRSHYYENVKLLLEAGASLNVGSDMFGRGPLDFAETFSSGGQGGFMIREGETQEEAIDKSRQVYELVLQYAR